MRLLPRDARDRARQETRDDLLMVGNPDIEAVNLLLERYGRELYRAGCPYGHYSETVNAVSAKRPSVRRLLQPA